MSDPSYYWLVTGQVVTRNAGGIERQRNMNAIVMTDAAAFKRKDMAKAQHAVTSRFVMQAPQTKGFEVVDVVILNLSLLGHLTPEEFHEGFDQPGPVDPLKKAQELN